VTAEMVRAWCDRGVVRWGGRGERGAKADGACVRGAKREKVACVERAWCERGEQIREVLCIVCPDSFSLLCSLWVRNHASANRVKEREQDGCRDGYICGNQFVRQRDRQRSS